MVKICPTCKKFVPMSASTCPMCGNAKLVIANPPATTPVSAEFPQTATTKKRHSKSPIVALFVTVVIIFCTYLVYNNVLWGKDKIAYDLIVQHAYTFKNPSSVRVISGRAGKGDSSDSFDTYAFLRLSATNGFGATVSGYYCLDETHISDLEEDDELLELLGIDFDNSYMIELCKEQKQLNVKKINKALERKLG